MEVTYVDEAIELLEKANADLEPELLSVVRDASGTLLRRPVARHLRLRGFLQ
jgi:hypothetical protein